MNTNRIETFSTVYRLSALLSVLLVTGCSILNGSLLPSKPSSPPLPPEQYLADSDVVIHETDMLGDPISVILGVDVVHRDGLSVQLPLREGLYKALSENRVSVQKVGEASNTEPFREAIEWSQFNSTKGAYYGEQKINYIVSGNLELSNFESRYKGPSLGCRAISDNCKGKCKFEAEATLSIEAEALPSKRRAKQWVLSSNDAVSFKVEAQGCPQHNAPGKPWQYYQKIRDGVLDDLLSCSRKPLRDYFSSRGYIKSYHSDGQNFVFTMSAGYAAGFSKGDSVVIERLSEGELSNEAREIAKGKVSFVGERLGYITVQNEQLASQIKKHDRVRLVHKSLIPEVKCKLVRK